MWFRTLFDSLKAGEPAQHQPSRQRPASSRLAVEVLEDRCVPATLTISDVSIIEGNAGTQNAAVTVTLTGYSGRPSVSVNYHTAPGTASAGSDYEAVSGTLTFARGETSKSILVPVFGDTSKEVDETFFVNLSVAKHATIADGQGVVTIQSDDNPVLHISDYWDREPYPYYGGSTLFTFTVWLSMPSSETVTVNFSTSDGSATAGADYLATSGTLTFAPGETSKTIDVVVLADLQDYELPETFYVNLSGASSNALIQPSGIGTGTIYDYWSE
jgi:Calx-beta domain-containing protein